MISRGGQGSSQFTPAFVTILLLTLLFSCLSIPAGPSRGEDANTVRIAAVGDVMLSRSVERWSRRAGDYGYPFAGIRALLQNSDLAFCNLECALTRKETPVLKGFTFKAHPQSARHLKEAGFSVVSLANNHAVDYGDEGFQDTVSFLSRHGLPTAGIADGNGLQNPVLIETRGVCIGWLAYCSPGIDPYFSRTAQGRPPIAMYESRRAQAEMRAVRKAVDLLIVSLHYGREYSETPTKTQSRMVLEAVRSGASVILGHHQHVIQGIEVKGRTLIAHGLGNFVFDQKAEACNRSIILEIEAGKLGVRRVTVRPVVIVEGQPRLATGETAAGILLKVRVLSETLKTSMAVSDGPDGNPSAELLL